MAGAVELVIHHPPSAAAVNPGQFFQLAVAAPHTVLRRPYSAAWSDAASGRIGFIFNVVGAGSAWLSERDEGSELDLLGPLGRGFELGGDRPAVCIAVREFPGPRSRSPSKPRWDAAWERALVARRRGVRAATCSPVRTGPACAPTASIGIGWRISSMSEGRDLTVDLGRGLRLRSPVL